MKRFLAWPLALALLFVAWFLQNESVEIGAVPPPQLRLHHVQFSHFSQAGAPQLHLQVQEALYGRREEGQLKGIRGQTPEQQFEAAEALYLPRRYLFYRVQLRQGGQQLSTPQLSYFPDSRSFWAQNGLELQDERGQATAREAYWQGSNLQLWGAIQGAFHAQSD